MRGPPNGRGAGALVAAALVVTALGGAALGIGALGIGALATASARADYLVADLSERRISITLGFAGAEVLLFGATDGEGEVAVVVRGPAQPVLVRRKERISGVWVNRAWVRFDGAPAFYRVASSQPLLALAPPALLEREEIGVEHLRIESAGTPEETEKFRLALIRSKERERLYGAGPGHVTFIGERLFRTTVDFPANVAPGAYTVEVFLIRDGQVTNAQRWPLFISKEGLSAEIFDFAHRTPGLYGVIAVLVALMAGWLAAVVFRRM